MERTAPEAWRIAVLTSGYGRGSNLWAMHRHFREHALPVEIAFVTVSRQTAPVFRVCGELGLKAVVAPVGDMDVFEQLVAGLCEQEKIDLVALAGFMKQLSAEFLQRIAPRPVLNIHPALLPAYGGEGMYGARVHEAVFAARERYSGASVHLVDPEYDHGPVIARRQIDISGCASPEEVAAKVLEAEHSLYGQAIYEFLNDPDRHSHPRL